MSFVLEGGPWGTAWTATTHSSFQSALQALQTALAATGAPTAWVLRLYVDTAPSAPFAINLPTAQHRAVILGVGPTARRTRIVSSAPVGIPFIEARGAGELVLARLDLSPTPASGLVPFPPVVLAVGGVRLTTDSCAFDSVVGYYNLPLVGVRATATSTGRPALSVSNCLFSGCRTGVDADGVADLVVQDSAFEGCAVGLRIDSVPTSVTRNSVFARCEIGQLTTFGGPSPVLSGAPVRHSLSDCRFEDCEIGLDFDYVAEASWAEEPVVRVDRCEFSAPSAWSWIQVADSDQTRKHAAPEFAPATYRLRSSGLVIHTGLRVRFGRPVGATSPSGYFSVQRCLFNLLELGISARPGPRPAVFVDHNTFVSHREAAIRVGGSHKAWANNPTRRSGLRRVSSPGLVVSNNVFEGQADIDGRSDPFYGAIEFVVPWPDARAADPPAPAGESVVIAGNAFRGFWRRRNLVFSRSGTQTAEHFGSGNHWHRNTMWENTVGLDPVLARLPETGHLAVDIHPVVSLGSPLPGRGLAGAALALLGSWGYPTEPGDGFYGNEASAAGTSLGAAEPAGWREFPMIADGVGTDYDVVAPLFDVALTGGSLNVDRSGQPPLSGSPALDAWSLFSGDALLVAAASAKSRGVKLAVRLSMNGPEAFSVRGISHGFPAPPGQNWAPSGPPQFNEFPPKKTTEFDAFGNFRQWWLEAASAFLSQLKAHPDVVSTIAYIWGPEEPTPNIYGASTGGYPRQYAASLLLRGVLDKAHPEYRFLTYQDNAHGVAAALPSNKVGWAGTQASSVAAMGNAATMMVVGPYALDLEPPPYLWADPYGRGQEQLASGASIPGRPSSAYRDPAVSLELTTPPPAATEAAYDDNDPTAGAPGIPDPNIRAYPAVDELDFLAPVFDGLLVGVYWQRVQGDLFNKPQSVVPSIAANRLMVRQRTRGLLEASANAESLARQRSQTAGEQPTVLGLELVRGVDADDPSIYRVSPRNSTFSAHDLLLGLQEATGLFLWGLVYRSGLDPTPDWSDWEGSDIAHLSNDTEHPGWEGYRAIFELLKTELREFLVFGDREFDLGFEIISPSSFAQEVVGSDWGPRVGFVQKWQRTNHLVLRARNRVYLIVTRSQTEHAIPVTTFVFGRAAFGGAVATTLWPTSGPAPQPSSNPGWLFEDTLAGIDARVYRIDLP